MNAAVSAPRRGVESRNAFTGARGSPRGHTALWRRSESRWGHCGMSRTTAKAKKAGRPSLYSEAREAAQ